MNAKLIRILLIEDNSGDDRLIQEMLKEAGAGQYDFNHADRLSTGLEHLSAQRPDIVLLDLGLPDSQGLNTLARLLGQAGEIPVIVLTGMDDDAVGMLAIQQGAQDYLVKGQTTGRILWRVVHYAIERKRDEEALKSSEQNFHNSVDDSPLGIRIQSKDFKFLYANKVILDTWGYRSLEELIAVPEIQLFTPETYADILKRRAQRKRGEPVPSPVETSIVRKDGEIRRIKIWRREIIWDGQKCDQMLSEDITEHKQAEMALRESQKKYQDLYDEAPIAYYSVDTDGNILIANKYTAKLLGYTMPELIGRPVFDLYADTPAVKTKAREVFQRFLAGQDISGEEIEWCRTDGKNIYVSLSVQPILDSQGKVIASRSTVVDITERKQAEMMLKESEEKYRNLVERANDGICIIQDRLVKFANARLAEMWGGTIEELINTPFVNYIHPDELPRIIDRYNRRLAGEQVSSVYETVLKIKDGSKLYTELNVGIINYLGKPAEFVIIRDITERKRMNERLRDSEVRYRRLFETAQDAILILDGNTGQIIDANPFIKDLLGYSLEDLQGKNLWEISELKDVLASKISYQQLHESGYRRWDSLPLVTRDGRRISVEVVANAYQVDRTQVIQCNIRDMTIANMASEALKEVNQDLKIAQRLTKIGNWKWIIATNKVIWSEELCHINGWDTNLPVPPFAEMDRFYTPESWGRLNKLVTKALNTGESYELELTQIRTDGTKITTFSRGEAGYDASGKIVGLHGTVQDVTERKQAEEALRKSEENFRGSLDDSPVGIRIVNNDGETVYANRAVLDIYGYDSIEELKTTPTQERYTPESYAEHLVRREMRQRGERVPDHYEISIIRKDGRRRHLEVLRKEVHWNGKPQFQVLYTDITERRQREEDLKQAEQNFRHSVNDSPLGMRIQNKDFKFLYANKALLDTWGYASLEELIAVPEIQRFTPERYAALLERRTQRRRGEPVSSPYETSIVRKDGEVRHIKTWRREVIWDGQRQDLLLSEDITAHKQAETLLEESEEKFRGLAEQSPSMVFINQAGSVVYVNPQCAEIMGYTREEFYAPDFDFLKLIAPESRELAMANFRRHMGSAEVPPCDYTLVTKEGRRIDVILATKLLNYEGGRAFVGIMTDITERKQAEATLKVQAGLLDAELDSVYLHDFEGNFLYVNKTAYLNHGYTKEELLNMKLNQLDDPESARLIAPRLKEIFENGQATFEVNHRHKNGSLLPLEIHTSLVEFGGKQMVMSVARDITERKKMQEQLMAQDRLASIGQLVSGVAHEINNPLTGIIGFSELLLQRENLPDDVKADLKVVNDEAMRTALIVKNLLTFSRKQSEEKAPLDINGNIQKVLNLRDHEQKISNIVVDTHFAADLPLIMGNDSQLQQVFFNIVINAEFFMLEEHNKGNLTITTESMGDLVRCSIADDGPGISEGHMRSLFTPFFTTKEVGKGTGLGLSICHGIITEHGGKIYAESEVGKGATFIVELPIIKEATIS